MNDQELLQAIRAIVKEEIDPMKQRMDSMEQKLDTLIEAHEITRDGVNRLLDWSEKVSTAVQFPLPDVI